MHELTHNLAHVSRAEAASAQGPPDPLAAERLGLPSSYDPRFRVSATHVSPPERLGVAVRAIARRMAQRAAQLDAVGAGRSGRDTGRDRDRDMGRDRDRHMGRDWDRDRDRDRGGGSKGPHTHGEVTPDIVEAATKVG